MARVALQLGGAGHTIRVRAFSTEVSLSIIIITIYAFQDRGGCACRYSGGTILTVIIIVKVVAVNAFGTYCFTRALFAHAFTFLALVCKRVEVVA